MKIVCGIIDSTFAPASSPAHGHKISGSLCKGVWELHIYVNSPTSAHRPSAMWRDHVEKFAANEITLPVLFRAPCENRTQQKPYSNICTLRNACRCRRKSMAGLIKFICHACVCARSECLLTKIGGDLSPLRASGVCGMHEVDFYCHGEKS